MKLKAITGIMLTLLLTSMLSSAFNMPPTAADTDFSVNEDRGNLNTTNEWADFAKADGDSAELVIGVNNGKPNSYADIAGLIGENGGDSVGTVSMGGEIRAVVADIPLVAVSSFVTEVRNAGLSRYLEPNIKVQACFVPNDPNWTIQWGPAKIEADYAWNTTIGDPSVLVAVIDTGIDWNHPDLAANYVPLGYDWVNNDTDPMDDHGHGTHCAGIIAAVLNNNIGIAGLAQVSIMAEKGLDEHGRGYSDDLANAIIHAVNRGARILSNSWGGSSYSELIHDAVEYAQDHGVLVVASAGNDASSMRHFPAAYDEVIGVTATQEDDAPWHKTNFGDWVELAAPGVDIYSTVFDDSYASHSGTSMSTPHVAGVAALAWSVFPNATRDWVRVLLRNTADDLGTPGFDVYYGWGRINARKAVELVPPEHDVAIMDWETPLSVEPGCAVLINTTVFNFGSNNETNITVQLLVNGSLVDSTTIDSLEHDTSATVSCLWIPMRWETYNLTFNVLPVPSENFTANNVVTIILGPLPKVYVHPPISYAALGQTFSVNVSIANVTNLLGYDFQLYYNTTILDAIELVMHPFLNEPTFVPKREINDRIGRVWLGVLSLWPAWPVSGSGTLATITFEVAGVGGCVLDLYNTKLADSKAEPIPHSEQDGYFEYTPLEHDIAAFLDIPVYHLTPGDSALLKATVLNGGLNNETDVELRLLINGSIVDSTVIDFLQVGSSYTISYLWTTSTVEGIYNVTAYALPVPNEDFTLNNMESARVPVSYVIRVPYHYPMIQEAIDRASPKATILVSTGTYYEWLTIYKSLTLVGEENSTPIIDGGGADVVIRVTADNVDISKFTIQNGGLAGIYMIECNYITIRSNTIANNSNGIAIQNCNNSIINSNVITKNTFHGIRSDVSYHDTISGNTVSNNGGSGIYLTGSYHDIISGNTVSNNGVGISGGDIISGNTVSNNGVGIRLYLCSKRTVEDNMITNNTDAGIYLYGYVEEDDIVLPPQCYNNSISGNTVSDNGIGIYANYTENNTIYHNSFINNAEQVLLENSSDIWDNGCEGNYWSDYAGEDLDRDGIGDTLLPHQGVDNYPLMSPYMEGDVNHDAIVDIFDLVIVAIAYGSRPGDPNWNPHADLNGDDVIDINDIVIAAIHFGEKW